jgi:hypothetical protein
MIASRSLRLEGLELTRGPFVPSVAIPKQSKETVSRHAVDLVLVYVGCCGCVTRHSELEQANLTTKLVLFKWKKAQQ